MLNVKRSAIEAESDIALNHALAETETFELKKYPACTVSLATSQNLHIQILQLFFLRSQVIPTAHPCASSLRTGLDSKENRDEYAIFARKASVFRDTKA